MLGLPYPVVLASASPRRIALLRTLVPDFEVLPADLDEEAFVTKDPVETAEALAREKAMKVASIRLDSVVIGADTVVALGDIQLAKPTDAADAFRMLSLLSGKTHEVVTGICFVLEEKVLVFSAKTHVSFRQLSEAEIGEYVAGGEPMDKAGAYAIQGGASGFVSVVDGSLTNVIGFPMEEIERRLKTFV
ncbi:MAG TPA: Maf family protein [Fimbriimonadaceae bacterium]|jgi:septum formation protein